MDSVRSSAANLILGHKYWYATIGGQFLQAPNSFWMAIAEVGSKIIVTLLDGCYILFELFFPCFIVEAETLFYFSSSYSLDFLWGARKRSRASPCNFWPNPGQLFERSLAKIFDNTRLESLIKIRLGSSIKVRSGSPIKIRPWSPIETQSRSFIETWPWSPIEIWSKSSIETWSNPWILARLGLFVRARLEPLDETLLRPKVETSQPPDEIQSNPPVKGWLVLTNNIWVGCQLVPCLYL